MRIVHSLTIALLAAPLAFMPVAAHADTIDFGSGIDTVTFTNSQTIGTGTAVLYTSTNPYSVNNYTAPASGTSYITWNDSQDETLVPAGDTTYSLSLTGPAGATGSVLFAADNSVIVDLNGTEIGSSTTFNALTSADFTLTGSGDVLSFIVTNTVADPEGAPNPTALDFGGSFSFTPPPPPPPPTVPEPSSIALLGTGLLGMAGFARRKFLS